MNSKLTFTKEHTNIAKGIAVMMMLYYHLFQWEWVIEEYQIPTFPLTPESIVTFARFGNICVAIFVFLTGYGIAKSIGENDSLRDSYKAAFKRFGKLIFSVILCFAIINLAFFWTLDYTSLYGAGKQSIALIIADATGLSDLFHTPRLIDSWWYVSMAYALIFLVPLLKYVCKKIGPAIIPVMIFAFYFIPADSKYLLKYLVTVTVGVCAANEGWLDKLLNIKLHKAFQWLIGLALIVVSFFIRSNAVIEDYFTMITEPAIAFVFVWISAALVGSIPGIRRAVGFVGKYSMGIYLVHFLFCIIFTAKYLYSIRFSLVVWLVLLVVSLVFSLVLELIKSGIFAAISGLKKKS